MAPGTSVRECPLVCEQYTHKANTDQCLAIVQAEALECALDGASEHPLVKERPAMFGGLARIE